MLLPLSSCEPFQLSLRTFSVLDVSFLLAGLTHEYLKQFSIERDHWSIKVIIIFCDRQHQSRVSSMLPTAGSLFLKKQSCCGLNLGPSPSKTIVPSPSLYSLFNLYILSLASHFTSFQHADIAASFWHWHFQSLLHPRERS